MEPPNRRELLNMAGLVEAGLVVAALFLGWMTGINPVAAIHWRWDGVLWGLAASVPLFGIFLVTYYTPFAPLQKMKQFLHETLGPPLAECRWYDLILLALMAGYCEELLFRGFLQPYFGRAGFWVGLVGSNLLFAFAHSVTVFYMIFAGVLGMYLGVLPQLPGPPNLLVPIVTHAFYDYLAFHFVAYAYRSQHGRPAGE